jgi:hypothetical protein
MNTCKLLDRYRDGELAPEQRAGFELHIRSCPKCRLAQSLLNNIVNSMRTGEPAVPFGLAERIASRAFRQRSTWETYIVGWLKPKPVWAAVGVSILLLSGVLAWPGRNKTNEVYSLYETLWRKSTEGYFLQTEDEFVRWVQYGGRIQ